MYFQFQSWILFKIHNHSNAKSFVRKKEMLRFLTENCPKNDIQSDFKLKRIDHTCNNKNQIQDYMLQT